MTYQKIFCVTVWGIFLALCLADFSSAGSNFAYEQVIQYGEFRGRPAEIVHDERFRDLAIRVVLDPPYGFGDPELKFLVKEVVRLTLAGKPIKLGKTGYVFSFTGYPLWGPYLMHGQGRAHYCFLFGKAEIKGKKITARGHELPDANWLKMGFSMNTRKCGASGLFVINKDGYISVFSRQPGKESRIVSFGKVYSGTKLFIAREGVSVEELRAYNDRYVKVLGKFSDTRIGLRVLPQRYCAELCVNP